MAGLGDVQLNLVSLAGGFLADAGPALELAVDRDGARTVDAEQRHHRAAHRPDVNGARPRPDRQRQHRPALEPLSQSCTVLQAAASPRGKYDAVTILTHEIATPSAISGARDPATGRCRRIPRRPGTGCRLAARRDRLLYRGERASRLWRPRLRDDDQERRAVLPSCQLCLRSAEQGSHGARACAGESRSISPLDLAIRGTTASRSRPTTSSSSGRSSTMRRASAARSTCLRRVARPRSRPARFGSWIDAVQNGTPLRDIAKASSLLRRDRHGPARSAMPTSSSSSTAPPSTARPIPEASRPDGRARRGHEPGRRRTGLCLSPPEHVANLKSTFDAGVYVPEPEAARSRGSITASLGRAPDSGGLAAWTAASNTAPRLSSSPGRSCRPRKSRPRSAD